MLEKLLLPITLPIAGFFLVQITFFVAGIVVEKFRRDRLIATKEGTE